MEDLRSVHSLSVKGHNFLQRPCFTEIENSFEAGAKAFFT